jgi:hypothetical protein
MRAHIRALQYCFPVRQYSSGVQCAAVRYNKQLDAELVSHTPI